ncbi:hypothetical protein DPMN_135536, partial [Dreissena polymorpha]
MVLAAAGVDNFISPRNRPLVSRAFKPANDRFQQPKGYTHVTPDCSSFKYGWFNENRGSNRQH